MTRIAVYPGSFDPITRGHEDLVRRSLVFADRVIIAVVRLTSADVRYRCCSSALRSSAPRMVTFTTLAESNRRPSWSRQTTPVRRSATVTETIEDRERRAAAMSPESRAASA